jgi:ketosteroid isomerase-like protein
MQHQDTTPVLLEVTLLYDAFSVGDINKMVDSLDPYIQYTSIDNRSDSKLSISGRTALRNQLRSKRGAIDYSQWTLHELHAKGRTVTSSGVYRGRKCANDREISVLGEWTHELHFNADNRIDKFIEKFYELEEKF